MADTFEEVGLRVEIGVSVKKRKSENQNVICSFFSTFSHGCKAIWSRWISLPAD